MKRQHKHCYTHSSQNIYNSGLEAILSNNIQNIEVELRNEAGKLIPFNGTGKVIVGLKFQKIN